MLTSDEGKEFIKSNEGCRLKPYQDQGGTWTVGYGKTGTDVVPGVSWSQSRAERAFEDSIESFEDELNGMLKVDVTQNQFDALMDFVYNLGPAALQRSTLLKKVNAEDFNNAANEFLKWTLVAGRIDPGLVKRRKAERLFFLTA